jgi:dienelactone hydrolase
MTVALAGMVPAASNAAAPAEIQFDSTDGTPLKAWLFLPDGPPKGAVVALHGCGGIYSRQGERFTPRHQGMADLLVQQGYAVVFPDSLTPRGESQICTTRIGQRKITQTERRADTLAALSWVAQQPWAKDRKLALLGWSHGGSAVLASTDASRRDVSHQAAKPAVAIAFYPGCGASLRGTYRPSTRLAMMLGEKDDWTPAAPCIELGARAGAEVHVYPDSYHDFDNPSGRVRMRTDVPNGVNPGQGVHTGPNPAAREKAYARVIELLAEALR